MVKRERGNYKLQELRETFSQGKKYAIATISPHIQALLESQTNTVFLSDDGMIKMFHNHPELEQDLLWIYQNMQMILDNAKLIVRDRERDNHITYFQIGEKIFEATIKVTGDKKELYLLTVHISKERSMRNAKKRHITIYEAT